MELTADLTLSALDALMDAALGSARSLRAMAAEHGDDPVVYRRLMESASIWSERLRVASELAQEIRARGLDNITLKG